jgi:hypothetical protein
MLAKISGRTKNVCEGIKPHKMMEPDMKIANVPRNGDKA